MSRKSFLVTSGVAVAAVAFGALAVPSAGATDEAVKPSRHVLLLSIDGMHQSDLANYVALHPASTLAALVRGGVDYSNAQTTFPSDSFPGMVAQLTGAAPGTSGVYYDDTFNHQLLPAATLDCSTTAPGAEVSFTEAADRSQNPITLDAGQKLADPALTSLPTNTKTQTLANSAAITKAILAMTPNAQALLDPSTLPVDPTTCLPVYPHSYLRTNTVFEVARAAGLGTAWSDKHPAYEILNGPSGAGIQDLFTPEINSAADNTGDDWTTDNLLTQEYDSTKVAAILNEIDGTSHTGTRHVGTPAIFGMNFQTVSTAEKLPISDSLAGGYLPTGQPGPLLANAFNYINTQVGMMMTRIRKDGLADSTTVILSAKHGQSPQNPVQLRRVDDGAIIAAIDAGWTAQNPGAAPLVSFAVDDDGMLLWLSNKSAAAQTYVTNYLMHHSAPANLVTDPKGTYSSSVQASGLSSVYAGAAADTHLGAPVGDAHAPDVLGIAQQGVVYTGGVKKIAEHGGNHPEDLNVPLVVSGAGVHAGTVSSAAVNTTQIAPTILQLLGLDPTALNAVKTDHTAVLPSLR